tara:strand:+ start:300 stop:581 length:282 start_codon:yes stop_codon:yes gene_type:complete
MPSKPLSDPSSLEITLSVKLLVQLVFFVITITGSWYTLNNMIKDNSNEIEHIKESLIEYEKQVDERVARLEKFKEQELEEVNKSLMQKILGKD